MINLTDKEKKLGLHDTCFQADTDELLFNFKFRFACILYTPGSIQKLDLTNFTWRFILIKCQEIIPINKTKTKQKNSVY